MTTAGKIVGGVGAAAILAAALFFFLNQPAPGATGVALNPTHTIIIGDTSVHVAIADTEASREQGLSGVRGLAPDEGMLFIFESDGRPSFWMKDMLFAIDMLWISSDGRVVFIAPSVSPDTFPQAFTPDTPARYVLEVPAGFSEKHSLEAGKSTVIF